MRSYCYDTPIRIQFGQQEVDGSVVSLKDGALILALEEDLGAKLPSVRLVADDSFLIQRLKDRLEEVQSGEAKFNRTAASPGKSNLEGKPAELIELAVGCPNRGSKMAPMNSSRRVSR